jgi:hypothetical protein
MWSRIPLELRHRGVRQRINEGPSQEFRVKFRLFLRDRELQVPLARGLALQRTGLAHVPPEGLNSLELQEGIARSIGDRNEAEPLFGIEPLHGRFNGCNGTDESLARSRVDRMRFKGYERMAFIVDSAASEEMLAKQSARHLPRKRVRDLAAGVLFLVRNHKNKAVVSVGKGSPTRWTLASQAHSPVSLIKINRVPACDQSGRCLFLASERNPCGRQREIELAIVRIVRYLSRRQAFQCVIEIAF